MDEGSGTAVVKTPDLALGEVRVRIGMWVSTSGLDLSDAVGLFEMKVKMKLRVAIESRA